MTDTEHPSRDDLFAYLVGTLPEDTADTVGDHVDSCTVCQDVLQKLDEAEDSLAARLRRRQGDASYVDEPECQVALERVRSMAVVPDDNPGSAGETGNETDVQSGTVRAELGVLGEYQLLAELGKGGMGTVYMALQTKLGRLVAVKVLPESRVEDPQALARFEREMRAVGALDHPNIVRAMDAREIDGTHFLVMEYVDGVDLSELVRRLGPLPVADACELIRQAAVGLQYAHEHKLVHRDIKPSNLMLEAQSLGSRVQSRQESSPSRPSTLVSLGQNPRPWVGSFA